MNLIFLLSEPDHQCVVPQLDALGLNESRAQEIRKLLVSEDECAVLPMRHFNSTRLVTAGEFEATSWNASWFVNDSAPRQPCEFFRYDDLHYDETVPTKWGLICSRGHLPSVLYSAGTAASVIGPVIIGALADKYGRKPTFFAIVALAILSGFGAVLSTNFIMFVVMRFINALLDPQIEQVPYIIIMELLDAKKRTLLLGVACMGWTLGMCLLTLVAYLSRTWVLLATVCASCVVPLFCYIRVIPESPRWLLSQDRLPEASAVLRRIAIRNGVEPPTDLDLKLKKVQQSLTAGEKSEESGSILDLVTKPKIRKNLLILTLIWSANGCAYSGLHINVTHLSGNEFLNFLYLALVEFPANAIGWWSMDRYGRRWTNVFFVLLTATACWAAVIAPTSGTVHVVSSIVAKFSTTAAYMMMYQQSDELFPTPLRSLSMGVLPSLAAIFTVSVPYIVYLGKYGAWIPFLFLAVVTMAAGIAAAWLPETKGYPLCQTVEDAEKFGNDQKFFSFNRIEESSKRSRRVEENDEKTIELQRLQTEA
ncbi:carcinine transporter isoform X3 [Dermacentor silvarum]|uniref:carcinine transporter isoform X3 n=1 Tax=Dermacentor silvarum TaxID=543639 RepID=UPI00210079AA|nr:carcinine transporter isoform X3 [Dermacentor silvarum]